MDKTQWKQYIISVVHSADNNALETLALHLEETDKAKEALRGKGYGCLGMGILETVNQINSVD